jgi:hypothetical protein
MDKILTTKNLRLSHIVHHKTLWDLKIEKCNQCHLPRPFNKEFYNVIQTF